MFSSFLTVGEQVLVLFILIGIGFLCNKIKLINEPGAKVMTDVVMYIVTPCVIIDSFQREFDPQKLMELGVAALCSALILFFSVIIGHLIFFKQHIDRQCIFKFATIFSNCGFMSLPLQKAVLGDDGVFFGAVFVALFNIFLWSYGVILMSGKRDKKALIKLLNPGIIGTIVGILFFVFSVDLPDVIASPVNYLAMLNTPLPMLVIGFYLAQSNLKKAFTDIWAYVAMALRLIILPAATLFVLLMCNIRGIMLVSLVISVSSPVAAVTTMMSVKYNRDTELSVAIVSASTVLSFVTMPLIIGFAQYLS